MGEVAGQRQGKPGETIGMKGFAAGLGTGLIATALAFVALSPLMPVRDMSAGGDAATFVSGDTLPPPAARLIETEIKHRAAVGATCSK